MIYIGGDLNGWSMKNILPQQCIFTGKVELHPDVYGPHSPEADAACLFILEERIYFTLFTAFTFDLVTLTPSPNSYDIRFCKS
jgi:hypothetical protein